MSDRTPVSTRVRERIATDLRPIRTTWSPVSRLALLVPLALVTAGLAERAYGRSDLAALGLAIAWGLSAIQWICGLVLLGVALSLAVPGHGLSQRAVWTPALGAIVLVAAVTGITYLAHPTFARPDRVWHVWYLCTLGSLQASVPLLIVSTVLATRAFPTNPVAVGALLGLAAGVISDSGWRLTCWISAPAHVVTAHGLAIACAGVTGGVLGALLDRRRWRAA